MEIGLKLWSTNRHYIEPAHELFKRKVFDYIELFVVKGSGDHITSWKNLGIPFVLHAPYSSRGLNFSLPDMERSNHRCMEDVEAYREALNPAYIIFHPGQNGTSETAHSQIKSMAAGFSAAFRLALIENEVFADADRSLSVGYSPTQIKRLMQAVPIGFCLDFSHAICSAASAGKDWREYMQEFAELLPSMYHICDGMTSSPADMHLHIGGGDYDIAALLGMIKEDNSFLSIERTFSSP